jgi:hypothetical protein
VATFPVISLKRVETLPRQKLLILAALCQGEQLAAFSGRCSLRAAPFDGMALETTNPKAALSVASQMRRKSFSRETVARVFMGQVVAA